MNSLVNYWKIFDDSGDVGSRLYSHPADEAFIANNPGLFEQTIYTPEEFIGSDAFGDFDETKFHLSLLPVPYLGNLRTADIFILHLNPGFGLEEYADDADPCLRTALRHTLKQRLDAAEYPFCKLNPALCRTAGFTDTGSPNFEALRFN